MLEFLRGKASERKFRLFACACCRRIWNSITHAQSRRVVEITEQSVDGPIDPAAITAINWDHVTDDCGGPGEPYRTAFMVAGHVGWNLFAPLRGLPPYQDATGAPDEVRDTAETSKGAAWAAGVPPGHQAGADEAAAYEVRARAERAVQAIILRDITGNPFRKPASLDPAVLSSNGGTVRKLAQAIYDERRFADLPVLADALEEAGCDNADLLAHCRQPGEHVRGCWVVDLLLGKE
jgi:hypothetical protein